MSERFRLRRGKGSKSQSVLASFEKALGMYAKDSLPDLRKIYFDSPALIHILGFHDYPGIHYIRSVNLSSDDLPPSEKLKTMLLTPLAQRIEDDFKGRQIVLQGLACSVTEEINFPGLNADQSKRRVIKSALGLLNPSVKEGLSKLPIYIPNSRQPLLEQDLPVFDFMIASATSARKRVIDELYAPRLRNVIFPAMLVIDLEQTTGYQVVQIPGEDQQNQQVVSLSLTGDRRARSRAILGLYLTDFPRITSGASKRKLA